MAEGAKAMNSDNRKTHEYVRISEMLRLPGNRPVRDQDVNRLAKVWNDSAVGIFTLSRQDGGSYYILDGQHRQEKLLREGRGGEMVFAEVHHGLSRDEELELCRALNADRKPWTAVDYFRMDLELGHPDVVDIKSIVESFGLSLNLSDSTRTEGRTPAVGTLRKIYRDYRSVPLAEVLAVLTGAFGNSEGFKGNIMEGTASFLKKYRGHQNFSKGELIRALGESTPTRLESSGRETKKVLGLRTEEAMAFQCHRLYNHRKRSRRLPPWGA